MILTPLSRLKKSNELVGSVIDNDLWRWDMRNTNSYSYNEARASQGYSSSDQTSRCSLYAVFVIVDERQCNMSCKLQPSYSKLSSTPEPRATQELIPEINLRVDNNVVRWDWSCKFLFFDIRTLLLRQLVTYFIIKLQTVGCILTSCQIKKQRETKKWILP